MTIQALAKAGKAKRVHVSPSQIATWQGCARKWAYSRIRPRSENRYAAFGSRAHTIAEAWLEHGTPPDARTPEGACIMAGLDCLPMPGTAEVETRFDETWGGVHYTGRVDFVYGYEPARTVIVGDHKTTGDLRFRKRVDGVTPDGYDREKDLREDPQRIVYSFWAMAKFDVEWIGAHWQYYRRKPPHSVPVFMFEHRDEVARRFDELHRKYTLPIVDANGVDPRELPRSLEHCGAFGGCPYREECHAGTSPNERLAFALSR